MRISAIYALGEVAQAFPALAPQCLAALLAATKDTDASVRSDAIAVLGEVAQASPDLAQKCLDAFLAATQDADASVRSSAINALGAVVQASPALAQRCLVPLLAATQDADKYVRRYAINALGKVAQASPALAQEYLAHLLAATQDAASYVRSDAIYALGEIPLEPLIERYWAQKNKELIPFILTRLYQTPLMITDNHQKMFFYDAAENVVSWDQPQRAIKKFKKSLQEVLLAPDFVAVEAAYRQQDTLGVIYHCEEARKVLPAISSDIERHICHNLACMYCIAALNAGLEVDKETYLAKAALTFKVAIDASETPHASVCTEYANFLLYTGQYPEAYKYLSDAITSGDDTSELQYGLLEKPIVSPILQENITQEEPVVVRAIDYAYYLLIHHYASFVKAGCEPKKFRVEYLEDYTQCINARASQAGKEKGKEKQDTQARQLLEDLSYEEPVIIVPCCIS